MTTKRTLLEKIWDKHVVRAADDQTDLIYIDLHLIHEVSSVQALHRLRREDRKVRRPGLTFGVQDHSVSTESEVVRGLKVFKLSEAQAQLDAFRTACLEAQIPFHPIGSLQQGIVHVIGPDLGLSLPGMTIVCGDSHTSTHGALGALAFGIGTSEVEHVLATQTLLQRRPKTMAVEVVNRLPTGVSAKDLVLSIIRAVGVDGGIGHVIEFRGEAIRSLSMDERMTVCNMSIEAGARAGLIAPDETTYRYLEGRLYTPRGEEFERAVAEWRTLATDENVVFDKAVTIDASKVEPTVTWGTTPAQSLPVSGRVPSINEASTPQLAGQWQRALNYMGLKGGEAITDLRVDTVFIGSCTNSRLEDLQKAANVIRGRKVAPHVRALVVPGSRLVKNRAEEEGLDRIFMQAGFEWREPGCSMCIGMNGDLLGPDERCASTSNRNFEGRQGFRGRTHLVSPEMAAAAAIAGHFVDFRELPGGAVS